MSESSSKTLIRGTVILTMATIMSKLLGFLYVVPFTALVGTQGNILFEYAYKPYVILLSMATMGIPLAVSKFISKYNELGDYKTGQRLLKSGLLFTTITGLIWFSVLYFTAPNIAAYLIAENDSSGNAVEHVVFVIRMVSFALIIVPPMAIARGYFQGHQSMGPTAISQLVEQLVRILFILIAAFVAIKVWEKDVYIAVGLATFAAFLGAVAGSIYLLFAWFKRKKHFLEQVRNAPSNQQLSLFAIYKELFSYAIPFVIVGLGISLYQTVDTFVINQAMLSTGHTLLQAETVNSLIALTQKVILIPLSLAAAFGLTLVPAVTIAYTAGNFETVRHHLTKTVQIVLFLTMPASIGLMILGPDVFGTLFGASNAEAGGQLMVWSAPTAILFALFLVSSSMLQGLNKQKTAVFSLLFGLLFKVGLTFPLVASLEGVGSVISTYVGMSISIIINAYVVLKITSYETNALKKQIFTIIWMTVAMAAGVLLIHFANGLWITSIKSVQLQLVIQLFVGAIVGMVIYGVLSIKTGVFFEVFGTRFRFLNRFNKQKTVQ